MTVNLYPKGTSFRARDEEDEEFLRRHHRSRTARTLASTVDMG